MGLPFVTCDCGIYPLPTPDGNEGWNDNPRTVCSDIVHPIIVRARREVVAF